MPDEKYPRLLSEMGLTGFPSLCFMDAQGNMLGKPDRSVKAMSDMLELATRLVALRAVSQAATPAEQKELFLVELELDLVPCDRIQARAETWSLNEAEKALVSEKLVDIDVVAIMREQHQGMLEQRDGAYGAARAKLYEMAKAGLDPSRTTSGPFWQQALEHASLQRDGDLAQRAFDALLHRYADEKSRWLDLRMVAWQEQLDAAKAN